MGFLDVWVKATSFVSKNGLRGTLVYVRNRSHYPMRFEVNGQSFTSNPGLSWFLVPIKPGDEVRVVFEDGRVL